MLSFNSYFILENLTHKNTFLISVLSMTPLYNPNFCFLILTLLKNLIHVIDFSLSIDPLQGVPWNAKLITIQ